MSDRFPFLEQVPPGESHTPMWNEALSSSTAGNVSGELTGGSSSEVEDP